MTSLWTAQTLDHRPPRPRSTGDGDRAGRLRRDHGDDARGLSFRRAERARPSAIRRSRPPSPAGRSTSPRRGCSWTTGRCSTPRRSRSSTSRPTPTCARRSWPTACAQAGTCSARSRSSRTWSSASACCDLADELGLKLAVNQNGRWAPHFSYLRSAVAAGLLGSVSSGDFSVYWGHDRDVAGTRFADMPDLILLDFGIHWFDIVDVVFQGCGPARRVYASVGRSPDQVIAAPAQAQVLIDFDGAQASLAFRGACTVAEEGRYRVTGSHGALASAGPALGANVARLHRARRQRRHPAARALVPGGLPRHDGRAAPGDRGRRSARERRPHRAGRAAALLRGRRLGPVRRRGGSCRRAGPRLIDAPARAAQRSCLRSQST